MDTTKLLKWGQIAGVLLMGAGVAAHLMRVQDPRTASQLLLAGGVVYAVCALTRWMRKPG